MSPRSTQLCTCSLRICVLEFVKHAQLEQHRFVYLPTKVINKA